MIWELVHPHPSPLPQEREKNRPRWLHRSVSYRRPTLNETACGTVAESSVRMSRAIASRPLSSRERAGVRASHHSADFPNGGKR